MPWEYAKDYIAQMAAPQMKVCRESVRPWMEGFTLEAKHYKKWDLEVLLHCMSNVTFKGHFHIVGK